MIRISIWSFRLFNSVLLLQEEHFFLRMFRNISRNCASNNRNPSASQIIQVFHPRVSELTLCDLLDGTYALPDTKVVTALASWGPATVYSFFMAAVTNCPNLVVKTKQISYLVVLEVSGPKVNVLARLHPTGGSRGESNSFPSSDSRSYLHSLVSGLFFHLQIQQFNIFQSHSHPNLPPFYEPNGKKHTVCALLPEYNHSGGQEMIPDSLMFSIILYFGSRFSPSPASLGRSLGICRTLKAGPRIPVNGTVFLTTGHTTDYVD